SPRLKKIIIPHALITNAIRLIIEIHRQKDKFVKIYDVEIRSISTGNGLVQVFPFPVGMQYLVGIEMDDPVGFDGLDQGGLFRQLQSQIKRAVKRDMANRD